MSGSAGGLLLAPLVLGIGPLITMALVGGALTVAASVARRVSESYERERRASRERIRQVEQNTERIGGFRDKVRADMREETRLNAEVASHMERELERSREDARALLSGGEPEKYHHYLETIQKARGDLNKKLTSMQNERSARYQTEIARSMETLGREMSSKQEEYLGELRNLGNAEAQRREKAKEIARIYLSEAYTLVESLRGDFNGAHFVGARLTVLAAQVEAASARFEKGRYETCVAVAKDASVASIEEIYHADRKKQEWENYHKLALTLAAEIEAYMMEQETVTEKTKQEVETRLGKPLGDEVLGVKIGDYTDRTDKGETRFNHLINAVRKQRAELESATPATASAERLREIASALNERAYPTAMTLIHNGILNMSNAFTRQNLSEEIINFFEEHNFTFGGYGYENDRHDGALHIGLENELTGEEIVVTLAPEVTGGEVQTQVSIDQLKGDERNEERKAYYRQAVQEVVAKAIPGASMSLECHQATRDKLSPRTSLREKLKR
ncbi:MAG: hypothetical protein LBD04_10690 [Synergistaceae bacterium]|jgi:hypothetical protein|nr:hypothetical protein [Synergistaceae bacterium]